MKSEKHEARMSNDARIAVLETTILNINTTLIDIKNDIKQMDKKFEAKFDKFEAKLDKLQDRLWSGFLWLIGMMIGLAGLIARTQHWI